MKAFCAKLSQPGLLPIEQAVLEPLSLGGHVLESERSWFIVLKLPASETRVV